MGERFTGYVFDPHERDRIMRDAGDPVFSCAAADSGSGKTKLLYEAIRTVNGSDIIQQQTIGDCVSHGTAKAIATRIAIQAVANESQWRGPVATEPLYGFSRVEIGNRKLGKSDGSVGLWAMEAGNKKGILFRQVYGKYDLRKYDGQLAKKWGWDGVPDELEPTADDFLIVAFALLDGWESLRDAIWNGWPSVICSGWLPGNMRDKDGFVRQDGSGGHCECCVGMTDEGRAGALIDGSWGKYFKGPKGQYDIPDSSAWVDAKTIDKRIKQYRDSYAVKVYQGIPDELPDVANDWLMI